MTGVSLLLAVLVLVFVGGIQLGVRLAQAGGDLDRHTGDALKLFDDKRRGEL
jgi:hypothetical protein